MMWLTIENMGGTIMVILSALGLGCLCLSQYLRDRDVNCTKDDVKNNTHQEKAVLPIDHQPAVHVSSPEEFVDRGEKGSAPGENINDVNCMEGKKDE